VGGNWPLNRSIVFKRHGFDILALFTNAQSARETSNDNRAGQRNVASEEMERRRQQRFGRVDAAGLRRTAQTGASALRREKAGHILQTSALINEVYLRLVNQAQTPGRIARTFLALRHG